MTRNINLLLFISCTHISQIDNHILIYYIISCSYTNMYITPVSIYNLSLKSAHNGNLKNKYNFENKQCLLIMNEKCRFI